MHIFKINVLFQDDGEDIGAQAALEESVETALARLHNAEYISSEIMEIANNLNCGRCKICGSWTSDHSKSSAILEFSHGMRIQEDWYCDLCAPADSPCRF